MNNSKTIRNGRKIVYCILQTKNKRNYTRDDPDVAKKRTPEEKKTEYPGWNDKIVTLEKTT